MKIHPAVTQISSPVFEESSEIYLIRSERNALIDTGVQESPNKDIVPALNAMNLASGDINFILNTHGHPDHTGGNAAIKNISNAQIFIHADDAVFIQDHERSHAQFIAPVIEIIMGKEHLEEDKARFLEMAGPDIAADKQLKDNDIIRLGNECELRVIHLPGHTPGSVGFYWEKEGILFCGDSMPGLHTENLGLPIIYDFKAYEKSVKRLQELPVRIMLQGHPFRGLSLPPSPVKRGEEVGQYLNDCSRIAGWILEAVSRISPLAGEKPFIEFADQVIAALPEGTGFIPMSRVPLPRFNALTILSALRQMNC